jgi:glycine oxidase
VRFQEGLEVLALEQDGKHLQGARVRNAEGTEYTLNCSGAVLCGGAWSARLLPALPVFPVKGQMLSLQAPRGALKRVGAPSSE